MGCGASTSKGYGDLARPVQKPVGSALAWVRHCHKQVGALSFTMKSIAWNKTIADVSGCEENAGCTATNTKFENTLPYRFLPSVGTWSRTIPPAVKPIRAPAHPDCSETLLSVQAVCLDPGSISTQSHWRHRPSVGTWLGRLPTSRGDAKQTAKDCSVGFASDPPSTLAIQAPCAPAPANRRPRSRGQVVANASPSQEQASCGQVVANAKASQEQASCEQISQGNHSQQQAVSCDVARMDALLQDAEASVSK